MAWIVLVDGYNVLKHWPQFDRQLNTQFDLARGQLIRMIGNFADYQGHRVIVVFDAGKRNLHRPTSKNQEGVEVVYTKRDQTADDYISEWIEAYRGDEHVEVVTSDQLLSEIVQELGASVRTTFEFSDTYARTPGTSGIQYQNGIPDSEPQLRDGLDQTTRRGLENFKRNLSTK